MNRQLFHPPQTNPPCGAPLTCPVATLKAPSLQGPDSSQSTRMLGSAWCTRSLGRSPQQPGVCKEVVQSTPWRYASGGGVPLSQVTVPSPAPSCPNPPFPAHSPSVLDPPVPWAALAHICSGDVKGCDIWEQTRPVSPKPLPAPPTPQAQHELLRGCSICILKGLPSVTENRAGRKRRRHLSSPAVKAELAAIKR